MKITCQSCGKQYDTDRDELCPRCGSYNSFTRGYDDAEKLDGDRSYHDIQKYREVSTEQRVELEQPKLSQERPPRTGYRARQHSDKEQKKGSRLGTALLQYLIIFVLVVVLVSFTAQKLFELMGRAVEQELLEMRVETQEAGSVFKTKDSMQYRVRGAQTIALCRRPGRDGADHGAFEAGDERKVL